MRLRLRALGALLLAAVAHAAPVNAQRVEVVGRGDVTWDARLRELIRDDALTVLPNDTVIAPGQTIRGPVLAAGITIRISGTIEGDLIGVDANVFLRPGGRITGDVINVAGGYYPSEQASVGGTVTSDPNAPYDVERDGDLFRIVGTESRSLLELDGVFGFHPPGYDRVDGLNVAWGARYLLPRIGIVEPFVAGRIGYALERKELQGGGEIGLRRRGTEVAFGAERWTLTNEEWIRNDLLNAWSTFSTGKDYRNYYEADRYYGEIRRILERGSLAATARLRFQVEDARSLAAGDPYSLFEPDSIRSNPAIDDGRITSAILGFQTDWLRADSELESDVRFEFAQDFLDGDFSFGGFFIDADYAMRAFANHTLEIETHLQGPLPGSSSLPRQRWSFVGGSSTLYTFEFNDFPGDRIAYVESEYFIPFSNRLRLPVVGVPMLGVFHHIGSGWTEGQSARFEQNIGARLLLFVVYLRAVIDPTDFDSAEYGVGITMPKSWPWQQ
jgi:hypothetical protein